MPKVSKPYSNQKEYVCRYIDEFIVYKKVNFNVSKPEENELKEWVEAQPEKVSTYLKRLIRQDMERNKK